MFKCSAIMSLINTLSIDFMVYNFTNKIALNAWRTKGAQIDEYTVYTLHSPDLGDDGFWRVAGTANVIRVICCRVRGDRDNW